MAKTDFRSQFKATAIKKLKEQVDDDNVMVGVNGGEYIQLEDGKTVKLRIFPAHPGVEGFYVRRKCYWLTVPGRDGETHRTTVLDSIIHGGTKMDIIQEYVKFAKKMYGKDTAKMEALVGTGPTSNSLNPQYSWICYAGVVSEGEALKPKLWEFKKMVRDALNRLSFSEDEDEAIEVDPFTDVDEGLPVLVKYMKKPDKKKGEQYYDVHFAKKPVPRPLSDEELEAFSNMKPLTEVIPTYGMSEFDRAIEGLQQFDDDNDFGLFDDDDWLSKVEEVKAQYDSDDEDDKPKKKVTKKKVEDDDDSDDDEEEKKPSKKSKKAVKEEEPEDDSEDDDDDEKEASDDSEDDEFTDMDRSELKKYIKKEDLDISVKKSMSDDDIRDAIRSLVNNSDDEDGSDDSEDDDDEEEEKPKSKVSLADIRNKLKGK